MYTKDYVKATYDILKRDGDVSHTLQSLLRYLKKRGLGNLYPSILRGLIDQISRTEKNAKPKVFLARESDFKKYEAEIRSSLKQLGAADDTAIEVNRNLIGGFIVQKKDRRMDKSYKTKLLHAYHRLTGN